MTKRTDADRADNAEARSPKGQFAPGNSGRPKGARHKVTVAIEKLMEGQAEALTEKAIELAIKGDTVALRLCLERIAPARRGRVVDLRGFPSVRSIADVPPAIAALVRNVAVGKLTPDEASDVSAILERYSKAVEVSELDARLKAIEDKMP